MQLLSHHNYNYYISEKTHIVLIFLEMEEVLLKALCFQSTLTFAGGVVSECVLLSVYSLVCTISQFTGAISFALAIPVHWTICVHWLILAQ